MICNNHACILRRFRDIIRPTSLAYVTAGDNELLFSLVITDKIITHVDFLFTFKGVQHTCGLISHNVNP